jgi:hypothetical protein
MQRLQFHSNIIECKIRAIECEAKAKKNADK